MATEKMAPGAPLLRKGDTARGTPVRPGGLDWVNATVQRFTHHLERDGLRVALGYLNSTTRFRYTGAYRFDAPLLCSIAIFDRENPTLALAAVVDMQTTYCSIVGVDQAGFAVDDAAQDARVSAHPAREQYAAYCGVPLRNEKGDAFGTLCHFDPRPRIGTAEQLEFLDQVAPLVAAHVLARGG